MLQSSCGEPEPREHSATHADVGLEHVAPHHDAAALGDRVGREDHGDDQSPSPGTGPDSSSGEAEPEQQLGVDDAVDDEERVPERAPEDRVGEELRVVREPDERASWP